METSVFFAFFADHSMRLLSIVVIAVVFSSCSTTEQKEERLARQHCGSCHLFPDPSKLDKTTWEKRVLPEMAFRMSLDMTGLMNVSEEDQPSVLQSLPREPMVTQEDFEAIRNYYLREAPESLTLPDPSTVADDTLSGFEVIPIRLPSTSGRPVLTMIQADTINKRIYISDRRSDLRSYTYDWKLVDSIRLSSPASAIRFPTNSDPLVTAMGIMDPNDQRKGQLLRLSDNNSKVLIDSMRRPVFFEEADLNNDGKKDFIVCEFGNYSGALVAYENLGNDNYSPHTITFLPGSRKVVVRDFDGDQRLDILVLFTQGDEQISLLKNAGGFDFRINTLLRFSAVDGSSFFDIADFNSDGFWDILYTNGDNADYSILLKPYHGLHLYLNDGKNQFKESWFHPMYGCSIAIARDFDGHGLLDIAAISFFPDFQHHPEQGFIYFRNDGQGNFKPFTTPLADKGRWLVMESLDIDNDMDLDLLLGALNFDTALPSEVVASWEAHPVDVLLLRNNRH